MASRGFIELLRLVDMAKSRQMGRDNHQQYQWRGISFELAGFRMVVSIAEVSEVLALPEYTSLPLVKPWLLGLANVRGRLLPLTDLSILFNIKGQQTKLNKKKVLVIDKDKLFSGLLVDKVLGIQQFSELNYRNESLPKSSPLLAVTHGKFVKDGEEWIVFMPSLLAHHKDYTNASI
ncbi:MAG: chemotaxis protein CheW [Moraxellaceae bacterium]|nr:chemotaxis protein CheW [Moraxellaceae bacterium]